MGEKIGEIHAPVGRGFEVGIDLAEIAVVAVLVDGDFHGVTELPDGVTELDVVVAGFA